MKETAECNHAYNNFPIVLNTTAFVNTQIPILQKEDVKELSHKHQFSLLWKAECHHTAQPVFQRIFIRFYTVHVLPGTGAPRMVTPSSFFPFPHFLLVSGMVYDKHSL